MAEKSTVDEHGRPEGENVARLPEPKVKPTTLTMTHINERVAAAKEAIAKQPPPPLAAGDWPAAIRVIENLKARVASLENKK